MADDHYIDVTNADFKMAIHPDDWSEAVKVLFVQLGFSLDSLDNVVMGGKLTLLRRD